MKLRPGVPIISVLTIGLAGLSCAEIASPARSEAYEWRLITGSGPGDTLSFHWPRSRLPVRVYTEGSLSFPAYVEQGLQTWEAAFLYGEFESEVVADSNLADIVVRVGTPSKPGFSVGLGRLGAPECEGETVLDLPIGSTEIQAPIRVFVNPRFDPSTPGVAECLALTVTHELGHAIGIFGHSPDPGDLMFSDPVVSELSERDLDTAELAYHFSANLTITPR
jgi:predicted Zn-dependent protease